MKNKELEVLNYLSKFQRPVRSAEISTALDISIRSVKNYVHNINALYDKNIILSSRNGYELNSQCNYSLLLSENSNIPQTLEERSFFIIKQLVLNPNSNIEIFDLCDSLCLSYSTIKSIISKMNKIYSSYHVNFISTHECVEITGNENDKRKLLSYVITEEAKNNFLNYDIFRNNFRDIDITKLRDIILNTFKNHNFYLNDFAAMNLMLHLLIIINGEKNGTPLTSGNQNFQFENKENQLFLNDFINRIEENFKIEINDFEKSEIYFLIQSSANFSIYSSQSSLKDIVSQKILDLTDEYIQKIQKLYMIDLSNEAFKTPFSLHLKNLLLRAKNGRFTSNPMTDSIRINSPLIFDISIYISLDLMDRFNIYINQDETAFLAIHIGSEIERQQNNKAKIPVGILCPNYHQIVDRLVNNLLLNFGNQIYITKCFNSESEIDESGLNPAIIFSTIPCKNKSNVIIISPINFENQLNIIHDALIKEHERYANKKLVINFENYFDDSLFVLNYPLKNKSQVITYLCDKLLNKKYVDSSFEKSVFKREEASSTAFGNIAVPHSVELDAIKTSIAVAISKDGFQWGTNTVHIVFLLAINKSDIRNFRNLYESLISLFDDSKTLHEIRNCTSFTDFKKIIYDKITDKNT